MPLKKPRYSSSLATAWVVPPASRPSSANASDHAQSDVPGTLTPRDGDHETATSSMSTSRSKYSSTIPSSWIIPALLQGPSNEDDGPAPAKSSNGNVNSALPLRVKPLSVSDREVLTRSPAPPAPVDEFFPQNRGNHQRHPKAALQDQHIEQKQNNRGTAGRTHAHQTPPAASPPSQRSSAVSPGTAFSATSASGSCDLCATARQVSPTYSVV